MKNSFLIGFLSFLVVVIVFGALIWFLSKPDEAQVTTSAKKFKEVPSIFRGEVDISALTAGLEKNGEVPVELPPEKIGREDPFAGL